MAAESPGAASVVLGPGPLARPPEEGAEAAALTRLNHLTAEEAAAQLLACCGCRRWALDVAEARPFENPEDLALAADGAFDRMDREGWLEAFGAHPRIGETKAEGAPAGREAGRWSAEEQAGTRAADRKALAELAAANRAYEARFGHVFLICATGKGAAEILAALRERMGNDPDGEFDVAALEQRQITHLRLGKLLANLATEEPGR